VGQLQACESAGIIVRMIADGKVAGRAILIAGPSGTGKSPLAIGLSSPVSRSMNTEEMLTVCVGMAKSLGEKFPFTIMSASKLFSSQVSKTEALTQALQKLIAVTISDEEDNYDWRSRGNPN